jgi:aryl-alcohol dehydrogenase-like predicted oxidoreductase
MAHTRQLAGAAVFPIGLGAMQMSVDGRPDEAASIRTIHAALDAGVNLIDTADAYCLGDADVGHNERLVAAALRGRRDGVIVATKGGHTRRGSAWELDGRPEHLRAACEASLQALETDRIDLYQYHRPDPDVPYAESIGALKELRDEGKIRWVGISNAHREQIDEARTIVELAAVQNELSLDFTSPLAKGEVASCERHGIAFLPWSPLGGASEATAAAGRHNPVKDAAAAHGVSPQRVALAWLLALSPSIIPFPGARRVETITDSIAAADLVLDATEIDAISRAAGVQTVR